MQQCRRNTQRRSEHRTPDVDTSGLRIAQVRLRVFGHADSIIGGRCGASSMCAAATCVCVYAVVREFLVYVSGTVRLYRGCLLDATSHTASDPYVQVYVSAHL